MYTVLFSGEDGVLSASMQVAVEGLTVDVADVVEGVSLMMAMYWAFDIEYRPSAKNNLVILERAMGVKETTITMTVLKAIGSRKVISTFNLSSTRCSAVYGEMSALFVGETVLRAFSKWNMKELFTCSNPCMYPTKFLLRGVVSFRGTLPSTTKTQIHC